MNCSEANDLFGDAIDGQMPSAGRSGFFEHLGICRVCRRSYELETMAKAIVKSKCDRVPTPPAVVQSIVSSIENESHSTPSFHTWLQEVFPMQRLIPALTASIAIVVFLVFFSSPNAIEESDAHTASNDVIFQSLQNFAKLQKGELVPTRTANRAEAVHEYLDSSGMEFAIVQPMDCCKSYSAITSVYDGIKLAHVVYTMDDDVMYVYQVRKKLVFEGSTLSLPPAARTALQKTGWYTDPRHPGCNVILWIRGGTLCAAVSSMGKDEMLAMLNQN